MRHRIARAAVIAALVCLPWLAACGAGADAPPGVVKRDSSGVRIVETRTPQWIDGAGWHVSSEPTVPIGVVDGPPEYQFHDIADVLRLPDGRIVVVNEGSAELRFYASDGSHLRSVGGQGGGPGSFTIG